MIFLKRGSSTNTGPVVILSDVQRSTRASAESWEISSWFFTIRSAHIFEGNISGGNDSLRHALKCSCASLTIDCDSIHSPYASTQLAFVFTLPRQLWRC